MKNFLFKNIILIVFLVIVGTILFLWFAYKNRGTNLKNSYQFDNYEIIMIDSCEYIEYSSSNGYLEATHKGDCKNPKHTKCNCK